MKLEHPYISENNPTAWNEQLVFQIYNWSAEKRVSAAPPKILPLAGQGIASREGASHHCETLH